MANKQQNEIQIESQQGKDLLMNDSCLQANVPVYSTSLFSSSIKTSRRFLNTKEKRCTRSLKRNFLPSTFTRLAPDEIYPKGALMEPAFLKMKGFNRRLRPCEDIHLRPPEIIFPNGVSYLDLDFINFPVRVRKDNMVNTVS